MNHAMNHAERCESIARLLQTEEGQLRLAELFEITRPASEARADACRGQMIARRKEGWGLRRIAEAHRCHKRFVRAILDAAGVA